VQQITPLTLDELRKQTSFEAATASAWLGPTIRACCFEVGEEVVRDLAASYGDVTAYVDRTREKPHVDLPRLTADLLQRHGFAPGWIPDSGLCTRCPGSIFHSYRREGGRSGRNLAIVAH
jgi:copper oxidase (laccase) domain-containing protein